MIHEKDEEREQILEQLHVLQALVNQKTHYSAPSAGDFNYESEPSNENPRFSMFNDVNTAQVNNEETEEVEKVKTPRQIKRMERRKAQRQAKKPK